MNPELTTILRLQDLDRQIAGLKEWIGALPIHLAEIEKQLEDIRREHHEAQERITSNQKQRKQYDIEIQTIEQKNSKYNNQLLDVKTNTEYRAFLNEIEFGKAAIRKIEDQILQLMIDVEGHEKRLKETEAELKRQQQQVAAEQQEAEQSSRQKQAELEALMEERKSLVGSLSGATQDMYERLAKLRNGVVMALVVNQTCTVCHVMLRPQTFNEVMRNSDIIQCSNCQRILYWIPPAEANSDLASTPVESAVDQTKG